MKQLIKLLPWFLVALFAAEIIAILAPKKDSGQKQPAQSQPAPGRANQA